MWQNILKYLLEGLGIAVAAKYLLGKASSVRELMLITVSITLSFIILDMFAPAVATGARQGVGFGTGLNLVQFGAGHNEIREGMDDPVAIDYYTHGGHPKISEEGQPIMHLRDSIVAENSDKMDLYYSSEELQRSTPSQVDFIGRFMDDRMMLSRGKAKKTAESKNLHERFVSEIRRERVHNIAGFDSQALTQGTVSKIEAFADAADNTNLYNNFTSGAGQTAAERGLVYGTVTVTPDQKHLSRINKTLYSGDLITLVDNTGNTLAGFDGSKYVRAAAPADMNVGNKLFKLRFELTSGHDTTKLTPIKYGSAVYLIYNDDSAQTHKVSHNGDLNMMDSNKDVVFELINPTNNADTGVINQGDDILIRRAVEGDKMQYLKVNTDRKRVETNADAASATKFKALAQKGCGPLWRFDSA